jgi:hypothetical protein
MQNQTGHDAFDLRAELHIELKVGRLAVSDEAVIVRTIVTDEDISFGSRRPVTAATG